MTNIQRCVVPVCDGYPTTIIKPGMLIRGLRSEYETDTVLCVYADRRMVRVASLYAPNGIDQHYNGSEEVRWPWEETWKPLKPKHTPMRGDLYRYTDGSIHMASSMCYRDVLICVDASDGYLAVGQVWSNDSVFGTAGENAFEYIGSADDILKVDA